MMERFDFVAFSCDKTDIVDTVPDVLSSKNNKKKFGSTHIFYPFAIGTVGTWHEMAIELKQEIGRRYHHYRGRHPGDNISFPHNATCL